MNIQGIFLHLCDTAGNAIQCALLAISRIKTDITTHQRSGYTLYIGLGMNVDSSAAHAKP